MQIRRDIKQRVAIEEVPIKLHQIEGKTDKEIDKIYNSKLARRTIINNHRRAQLEYIEGFIASYSESTTAPQNQ